MKIVGIIAEYNPFHNGHAYHIREALRQSGADFCVVVMSGDFVQRGEPAITDKRSRAAAALSNGADLVLELPVRYSTGSAEIFARSAVSILKGLNCVTHISFGMEDPSSLSGLQELASYLSREPEDYKKALKDALKQGLAFPAAREQALMNTCPVLQNNAHLLQALSQPNSILTLEYLKAMQHCSWYPEPVPVGRKDNGYHDRSLPEFGSFAGATAIREHVRNGDMHYKDYLPDGKLTGEPLFPNDFSLLLHDRLLQANGEVLQKTSDISGSLANRILKNRRYYRDFDSFCMQLKDKSTTYTHISRAFIHLLLKIPTFSETDVTCVRVLGIRQNSTAILSQIKQTAVISVITQLSEISDEMPESQRMILEEDIRSSNLYQAVRTAKYETAYTEETANRLLTIS